MILPRRKFLTGLVGLIAAPAVCKAEFLMPVKKIWMPETIDVYVNGQLLIIGLEEDVGGGYTIPIPFDMDRNHEIGLQVRSGGRDDFSLEWSAI